MKTWQDYVKEVKVTAAMAHTREVQGLVFALGLCGEAAEVMTAEPAELDKELGDVLWYLAALGDWVGVKMEIDLAPDGESGGYDALDLMIAAGTIADIIKKH